MSEKLDGFGFDCAMVGNEPPRTVRRKQGSRAKHKLYKCEMCDRRFGSPRAQAQHTQDAHETKPTHGKEEDKSRQLQVAYSRMVSARLEESASSEAFAKLVAELPYHMFAGKSLSDSIVQEAARCEAKLFTAGVEESQVYHTLKSGDPTTTDCNNTTRNMVVVRTSGLRWCRRCQVLIVQ